MFTVRLHWILTVLFTNYSPQYTVCAVYICCPFHNVIFFLNYCTIDSTTMSTAYPQHIHTILLQLHYPVYWLCCLYMLPLHNVTFFHNDCTIHSTTMFTAYSQHIHTVLFTITLPSILSLLLHLLYFSQYDIFSQLLHNWLYNNVYSISSTYTYDIVYNYTTQYTDFAVYICFLHTMWHFFTITAQLTLQQCLQHILNIYMRYCLQLHYPVCWICCLYMLSFSQCDIFPQLPDNSLYKNVYSISLTYTYSTVYNYTTQYTVCAFYICFLFTMWYFFTITAQFTLQQCLQHILNIYIRYCLQLHYQVYWLCCLYMLPLHNVTFFHNYCTIDSTTMSTAYP